jgi:hypothetical protein
MTHAEQQNIISELTRAKALFEARSIAMHMGLNPDSVSPEGFRIVDGQIVERLKFIPIPGGS